MATLGSSPTPLTRKELAKVVREHKGRIYVPAALHGDRMGFVQVTKTSLLFRLREEYDDLDEGYSAHMDDRDLIISP